MGLTKILSHLCRVSLCFAVTIGFFQVISFAATQSKTAAKKVNTQTALWERKSEDSVQNRGRRLITPEQYLVYGLNRESLKDVLAEAPLEFSQMARQRQTILELPAPNGSIVRFRIEESPILSPEIAAQFPDWKTYQGYGIDDPTATARFDLTPKGFHGYVLSAKGTFLVDPYQENDSNNYLVYEKSHVERNGQFHCELDEKLSRNEESSDLLARAPEFTHGSQIRTYRLAIATTFEYTNFFGSQSNAYNQVVTSTNRIVGVYRRDLAVSFTLVSGLNTVFNVNPEVPGNYASTGGSGDLAINQQNIDSIIGTANYDIGHVFQRTNGGVAGLGVVCNAANKARGLTGRPNPVGDAFDIDYVAHEIGHQFGANHTYNAPTNCGATPPTQARMEAGSGVTIMGYAGICSSTSNLARNSIDTFHIVSLTEVINFITIGAGAGCGSFEGSTLNNVPVITPLTDYTIPFNTPFALNAIATDTDGDALTYDWQQYDQGFLVSNYPSTTDDDDIGLSPFRPLMRPYLPTASSTRTFPSLTYILNNANEPPLTFSGTSATGTICGGTCITGEDLPSVARTLNFRVAVRDNKGGVTDLGMKATVIDTTTPFRITAPNAAVTWEGNSSKTITWDVSSTDVTPINVTNVKISLSTDGGQTFPIVILASTANDGSESITVPNVTTTQARVKVEAIGNIFFDINNANFTIDASNRRLYDFDGDGKADISVFRPSNGVWYLQRSTEGFTGVAFGTATDRIVPADYDGDGKTDIAVFRPSNGVWYIQGSTAGFSGTAFGDGNDIPVPADYDNDGKTDLAVFRPSNGVWYIQKTQLGFTGTAFGAAGDKPVAADYDGDGKTDLAVFRPSNGVWYLQQSTNGFVGIAFGEATDKLVPADYDGDNRADLAVFRPSNGVWYIQQSTAGFVGTAFGAGTDIPSPADYDGDGRADLSVFRESNGVWYQQRTTQGFTGIAFGAAGDRPAPNSFVR